MWPRAVAWSHSVLKVGTKGQPAEGNAWGDSGNKILWPRPRAGLIHTDFCPITNAVVTGGRYISISPTRSTAPLRRAKLGPLLGDPNAHPVLPAQDSCGPPHTANDFCFSLLLPVAVCELSGEDEGAL